MGTGDGMLPTGTVTLLLADVVGSTPMWQERPTEMGAFMASLDALVDEVVAASSGARPREQGEGDSFVAAFSRASDAIACATEIQQRLDGEPVTLRIGIHSGEVEIRDGTRYDGPTIIRASRLRDIAHGGQILLSSATVDLARDALGDGAGVVDLGSHELKGLDRVEHVWQLTHPSLASRFPPLRSRRPSAGTLPLQLTSFVGRTTELAEVKRLIRKERIVTLTGAGGCGKTRLAVEAVGQLGEAFSNVWFCDLGPLADPAQVGQVLRTTIGLPESAGRSDVDVVCDHVGDDDALIVLDNCEHLVAATAEVADTLLRRCTHVQIVTTSREPLGVHGELSWRVPSLGVPDTADAADAGDYDAIRLFVARAQRVRRAFDLDEANRRWVVEICSRLDGIPLAIELAAARLGVLSVERIAEGLNDRFRLLGRGARTLLARQQTLLASVGWSHDLLTEEQRIALCRLSIFAGGFSLEAAEDVVAGPPIDRADVLDLLSQLVERSLLVADESSAYATYRMLETIRQFARDKLVDSGESTDVATRHLEHYARLLRGIRTQLFTRALSRTDALAAVNDSYDNIRTAVEWAIADGQVESGLRLAAGLGGLFFTQTTPMRIRELHAWIKELLRNGADVRPHLRIAGLLTVAFSLEETDEAIAAGEEAIALAREIGDRRSEAHALILRGLPLGFVDPPAGIASIEEGVRIADEGGDLWAAGLGLTFLTQIRGGFSGPQAIADGRRAVEVNELVGVGEDHSRLALGAALAQSGEIDAGLAELRRAREIFDAEENLGWVSKSDGIVGMLLAWKGDLAEGRRLVEASVELAEQIDGDVSFMSAVSSLATLDTSEGRFDDAERTIRMLEAKMAPFPDGPVGRSVYAVGSAARAVAAVARDDAGEARKLIAKTRELIGDHAWLSFAAQSLAWCARASRRLNEIDEAESLTADLLSRIASREAWAFAPDALEVAAALRADVGEDIEAARLFGAVDAARRSMRLAPSPDPIWDGAAEIEAVRERLGDAAFDEAWGAGAQLPLKDAIDHALRGRGPRARPRSGWDSLTPTELKVVSLVAEGLSNPQIAEKLFVSPRTVSTHVSNIFAKLGTSSRSELAALATKRGDSPGRGATR